MDLQPLDWRKKYNSMKKKYNELVFLRYNSVESDIQTILARIEEHRRAHSESVADIHDHYEEMLREKKLNERLQSEIAATEQNIWDLKREISRRDIVLASLLKHPKLRAVILQANEYAVCSYDGSIRFRLIYRNGITFVPENFPREALVSSQREFTMKMTSLDGFLDKVEMLIK